MNCSRNVCNWFLLLTCTVALSCSKQRSDQNVGTVFHALSPEQTHISFANQLNETEDFNIIEYLYFYNGGGVAIGDINNDGLSDIYFTSNQNENKLYLNKGDFVFEDITKKSGTGGSGNWKTGVAMADVNGDGFLDIYVCGVGNYKKFDSHNQLFINNGDLTFTDQTDTSGLFFKGFSTHASFFDYDNDGDLDLYLVNHSVHTARSYGDVSLRYQQDSLAGDRLYQNQLAQTGQTYFRNVTTSAGILNSQIGYGLSVGVGDVNQDGWQDIYVSNDFHENDYLYINQGNGTFRQQIENAMRHTSRFSMGNDVADVNNDSRLDILTLDMLPKDEGVLKVSAGEDPYEIFQYKLRFGYHYQYARNCLQINSGIQDSLPQFHDMGCLAGVEATDWSWAPLLADFDNDGLKDIFITNGIERRPNNMDYISYLNDPDVQEMSDHSLAQKMPTGKVPNFFFRNSGSLTFQDVTKEWIGDAPSISNGAAYGDLDNDGDLDLVVNNLNEVASIFRNDFQQPGTNRYLQIELKGKQYNSVGIGTKVFTWAGEESYYYEQSLSRGWLSSVDPKLHIGLGKHETVDSMWVIWPDRSFQKLFSIKTNQLLQISQENASGSWDYTRDLDGKGNEIFVEHNALQYRHRENSYNSFNKEILMPHMLTTQGPRMAVGDVNGDQLEDLFIGGAAGQPGSLFIQDQHSSFRRSAQPSIALDSAAEDIGCAFLDANGDKALDLVVVSGGQRFSDANNNLSPRLYLNDRQGNFKRSKEGLPHISVNASCVKPYDIDQDGDVDLFVGGRVAEAYGIDPPSYVLINDGKGNFSDHTEKILGKKSLGMVSDAVWTEVNDDNKIDLIVVGEWMPLTVLIQGESLIFEDRTVDFGLDKSNGWWNTIVSSDIDKDGDEDFLVGNLGLNSRLRANSDKPISLYVADLDQNGSIEQILTYNNGQPSVPFLSRDQLIKQVPSFKKKFSSYAEYEHVRLNDILPAQPDVSIVKKDAFMFASVWLEKRAGTLVIHQLPIAAQASPIYAFHVEDLNNDGLNDILLCGNLYAVQPELGRYDASSGIILYGKDDKTFEADVLSKSGFNVPGEGRDIKSIRLKSGEKLYLVARNNNTVKAFRKIK